MRDQRHPLTEIVMLGIVGAIASGWSTTLLGGLAIRLACGTLGRPTNLFAGLQLALFGSGTGFQAVPGCLPPVALARTLDILAVAVLVAGAVLVVAWWLRRKQSDRVFVRELQQRDGLAKPGEVRRHASAKAVLRRAATLRPVLADPQPASAGWKVGRAHGRDVYVSIEDSIVVEGTPRSGKGYRFLVGAILDWDGPVVTTSTRNDNLTATMRHRARRGRVTVFDPQQLTGIRSALRISPVQGCDDPLVADQRGRAIVAGTALGSSTTNQEWAHVASSVLSRLLHAAAVSGRGADAVAYWGANPRLAQEAVEVLAREGTPGWAEDLDAIINGDEKLLASSWFGVSGAVRPLSIPAIREAMMPAPGEAFDADAFLAGNNTLYLVGTGTGAGSVGGFLGAVLDDVVETARRKALATPGSRLQPPLGLILDEIANMFSWPALPRVMADGGGVGISTIVVLQALSQAETAWSRAEADTIWSAGTAKLVFGGASDVGHLKDLETLLGTRRVRETGHTYHQAGSTTSVHEQLVPVMTVDELRRMPETTGLLAYRTHRGILLDLRGWTQRRDAEQITAGKTSTEAEQQVVFAQQYQDAVAHRRKQGEPR